jgi:peroxiredoxin
MATFLVSLPHTIMPPLAKLLPSALILVALCASSLSRAGVESGKPAPEFAASDITGKSLKLSDYRGKIVILEWVNPGCTVVVRHYRSGNMPSTQAAAAADGAVWIQINSNGVGDLDPAKTTEWQQKQGVIATAYIRDQTGKLGRLYGATATPHVFVIAPDGTLAYQGAVDDQPNASQAKTMSAHNYVKAALAALKSGKPIEKPATESYGCQVKYGSEN